jgi:ATP-dependent Clp protease ATP-binding subunit ClpA
MTSNEERTRQNLPKGLAKEVQYQIRSLSKADLSQYTYEHTRSDYKSASSDYVVYDADGQLVLHGRGFGNRNFFGRPLWIRG